MPLLGTLVLFWEREQRVRPCDECWAELDTEQREPYLPGGWLEGGVMHQDRFDKWLLEA